MEGMTVPEVGSVLGNRKYDLVEKAKLFSRVENVTIDAKKVVDTPSRFGRRHSLADVLTEAQNKLARPRRAHLPYDDVCKIIIAHFFDKPLEDLRAQLEYLVRKLELCSTGYTPMSVHFGPLFMYQDQDFLNTYKKSNPRDHYPSLYIQSTDNAKGSENKPIGQKEEASEKTQNYPQGFPPPFQGLGSTTGDRMMSINASPMLKAEDKARLLCSLIRANKLTDIIGTF